MQIKTMLLAVLNSFYVTFFAASLLHAQKKVTKEMHPVTRRYIAAPLKAGYPVLLKTGGSLKTRFAQTGRSLRRPKLFFASVSGARRRANGILGQFPLFSVENLFLIKKLEPLPEIRE